MLRFVDRRCDEAGLTEKTEIVHFTRRRMVPLKVQGTVIRPDKQVNYLCVIIDQKLQWCFQINNVLDQGKWAQLTSRRVLKAQLMHWLYVTMVRPALLHGAFVLWPGIKVQRIARYQ